MKYFVDRVKYKGLDTYCLQNDDLILYVLPSQGMTICRMDVFTQTIIDVDLERLKKGRNMGIPILYPTPNRVSGDGFTFQGKKYKLIYKDTPILMHGIAHHYNFQNIALEKKEDSVSIKGEFIIEKGTPSYEHFPFESKLIIDIILVESSVYLKYQVINLGEKDLPFGIGFHPFFKKIDQVLLKINANQVYDCDANYYPNGELLPIKTLPYDVSTLTDAETYNFDHVFTVIKNFEKDAEIVYKSLNISLILSSSDEFGHIVLYTPIDKDYFCIENQTCSADCHNLNERGYDTTGLQIVSPNQEKSGFIKIQAMLTVPIK